MTPKRKRAKDRAEKLQKAYSKPRGIIGRRLDRIEHVLILVATWVETGEWDACAQYVEAILSEKDEN